MSSLGKIRMWVFTICFCLSAAYLCSGWELQAPRKARSKKQAQAKPLPQLPPGPLQPLNLDQVPAIPPQVSYLAGQLTITAQNSTLGDILRAVRSKTGANFDVPASATERVVGQMGPGPPRDVLATLLNGSHFDYVMLGSASNPSAIDQLILTPKTAGNSATEAPPAEVSNAMQPPPGQPAPDMQNGDDATDNSEADNSNADNTDADANQDNNADQNDQAEGQAEGQADDSQDNGQQQQNGQQVRTPEQLLQELQQQQQRMQQQQQQGLQPGQPVSPVPQPGQPPNQPH